MTRFQPFHWEHASNENNGFLRTGETMEEAHGQVHGAVGQPMQDFNAAWDPIFYMVRVIAVPTLLLVRRNIGKHTLRLSDSIN